MPDKPFGEMSDAELKAIWLTMPETPSGRPRTKQQKLPPKQRARSFGYLMGKIDRDIQKGEKPEAEDIFFALRFLYDHDANEEAILIPKLLVTAIGLRLRDERAAARRANGKRTESASDDKSFILKQVAAVVAKHPNWRNSDVTSHLQKRELGRGKGKRLLDGYVAEYRRSQLAVQPRTAKQRRAHT